MKVAINGRARGFTLLEVLVAVAVLALALTAIISGGASYARTAGVMREKTLALWVAHNRLAELDLQPSFPQVGQSSDNVTMGGIDWTWRAQVQETQDPTLRRVDISVERKSEQQKHVYAELSSFMSCSGKPTQNGGC
jgi:general secretion pathway protein I